MAPSNPTRIKEQSSSMRYLRSAGSNPRGIKPMGNMYTDDPRHWHRQLELLGPHFAMLSDELMYFIFSLLDAKSLLTVLQFNRLFYCWASFDDFWKRLCLLQVPQFHWPTSSKSWRQTFTYNQRHNRKQQQKEEQEKEAENCLMFDGFCMYSDFLFQSWLCQSLPVQKEWLTCDNITRIKNTAVSVQDFIKRFEEPNLPVLIEGGASDWPASSQWTQQSLIERYGNVVFRAEAMDTPLENYFRYATLSGQEETPMYLFDKYFPDSCPQLCADYSVPSYFDEDLFSVLGHKDRPDYRWIIIGPEKSGSSFHKDPNATSAWNATVTGSKKWILYPPHVIPPGVYPSADGSEVTTPSSLMEWFMYYYAECKKNRARDGVIECVTRPGDIIFVPSGWWHTVINLEMTVAVTQNFVSFRNLDKVLRFLSDCPEQISGLDNCRNAEKLADRFRCALMEKYPHLSLKRPNLQNEHEQNNENNIHNGNKKKKCGFWQSLEKTATEETFSFRLFDETATDPADDR